jgi:hypothetical protein
MIIPRTMRKIPHVLLFVLLALAGCVTAPKLPPKENSGFHGVPSELTGVDWKRTPNDVLRSPVKDEPLIWLGVVKGVSVNHKEGKIEIEWYCEHLSFAEPGPAAISIRPVKARDGDGYFALSLILEDMTIEQAMKFKRAYRVTSLHAGGWHICRVCGKKRQTGSVSLYPSFWPGAEFGRGFEMAKRYNQRLHRIADKPGSR